MQSAHFYGISDYTTTFVPTKGTYNKVDPETRATKLNCWNKQHKRQTLSMAIYTGLHREPQHIGQIKAGFEPDQRSWWYDNEHHLATGKWGRNNSAQTVQTDQPSAARAPAWLHRQPNPPGLKPLAGLPTSFLSFRYINIIRRTTITYVFYAVPGTEKVGLYLWVSVRRG